MPHEVLRARQWTHVAQLRGKQSRVRLLELGRVFLAQLMPGLTRQTIGQESTAHPDAPVDAPDRQLDAGQLERLVPRDGVLIDAVNERAVQVEEEGRTVGHDRKATRGSLTARTCES